LALLSALSIPKLKFTFDFEQFFPKGDPDLEFFYNFIEDFESDDNFLLIAIENYNGVFDENFLQSFQNFSLEARNLPHVSKHLSLLNFSYPIKTPFGITTIPAIHFDKPDRYERDSIKILGDKRLVNHLISPDSKALVLSLKTVNKISLSQSNDLIKGLHEIISKYSFDDYHLLGIANFQKELVEMEKREIIVSSLISIFLIGFIIFFLYRSFYTVAISLFSVGLGMMLFMGFMALSGRELNILTALYPILMLIVGTSDIVHITTKYLDELALGKPREKAILIAIREIGWATLLTSVTTAAGFASLLTSKIVSIQQFGISAAIGVLIAYFTVILFSTSLLSYFDSKQLDKSRSRRNRWESLLQKAYIKSRRNTKSIVWGSVAIMTLFFVGISMITTNYKIESNLPIGKKISTDFEYFEKNFSGFRPMEFAVSLQEPYSIYDFEVVKEIEKLEQYLYESGPVNSIFSITDIFKSINRMTNGNAIEQYVLASSKEEHNRLRKYAEKIPAPHSRLLISKDKKKTRISSKISDIGADSIKVLGENIDTWINNNINPNIIQLQRTGTGLIIDKNSEYIRNNLLQGLTLALFIVSILMVFLFRNFKLLIISLIPNLIPLLFAAALIGFLGIELEAGVSIIFAIVFGIAVDDTIHFLSKYKLCLNQGFEMEEAIKKTFLETGRAISFTSIILFFGFLVLIFSIYPPSQTVGILISATLFSAFIADMLIIPILLRKFFS
jgi:predicted RND superfamily exporter protein